MKSNFSLKKKSGLIISPELRMTDISPENTIKLYAGNEVKTVSFHKEIRNSIK